MLPITLFQQFFTLRLLPQVFYIVVTCKGYIVYLPQSLCSVSSNVDIAGASCLQSPVGGMQSLALN